MDAPAVEETGSQGAREGHALSPNSVNGFTSGFRTPGLQGDKAQIEALPLNCRRSVPGTVNTLNLTNEPYLIRMRTKTVTELYFKDEGGWCKISARGRRFRATSEQVLNHLLPALSGLVPGLVVKVEHYDDPQRRPVPTG